MTPEGTDSEPGGTGLHPGHDGGSAGPPIVVPAEEAAAHSIKCWCCVVCYFNRPAAVSILGRCCVLHIASVKKSFIIEYLVRPRWIYVNE